MLEGKYAIASLIAVAVVGVALFWIWPKRISGVFVGPENSIEGRTSTSYYRERLDIREDGFAQVKVGPFGRLEAGAYSLSGKTITIKIETKEDGSKREKAETMQFRLDGNDVVLVKHLAGYDKLGYEGQRWKRN